MTTLSQTEEDCGGDLTVEDELSDIFAMTTMYIMYIFYRCTYNIYIYQYVAHISILLVNSAMRCLLSLIWLILSNLI